MRGFAAKARAACALVGVVAKDEARSRNRVQPFARLDCPEVSYCGQCGGASEVEQLPANWHAVHLRVCNAQLPLQRRRTVLALMQGEPKSAVGRVYVARPESGRVDDPEVYVAVCLSWYLDCDEVGQVRCFATDEAVTIAALVNARSAAFVAPLREVLVPEATLEGGGARELVVKHKLMNQRYLVRLADAVAFELVW